jgi:hypothetical protein
MKENGVTMLDNSKFVGAVVGAKQLGYDGRVIVEKVSNLAKLEASRRKEEEDLWTRRGNIWNKSAVV